jgi:glycosyltransferase involved in cell wall biosynthesis
MNIAILTEKFMPDFGGLSVSAGRLAGGLAASGHQLTVFHLTRGVATGQVHREEIEGATILRIGSHERTDDSLAAWFDAVCAAHQAHPFDLLHGFFLVQAGPVAALAGRFLHVPVVVSARGNDLDRSIFDPSKAAHILFAVQQAQAVTANTSELARKAAALGAPLPVAVIPNGVDAKLFCPGPPDHRLVQRLGLGDKPGARPLVGFTGEARAKKGLDTLLSAVKILSDAQPHTSPQLLLIGGARKGPDRESLDAFRAENPGLVIVVPPQPLIAMPTYYRLLDVLALPSRHDGLPNSLLEGMACGLPVVATAVGGMADLLRDGENALLVPAGSPQALADALQRLLANPDLRRQLGGRARVEITARFGLAQELAGYLNVYRSVLSQVTAQ